MLERFHEPLVRDMIEMRLQVLHLDVEQPIRSIVGTTVRDNAVRGELALPVGRYEDDGGQLGCILHDGKVGQFGHGDHWRREVRDYEALKMDVELQRPSATDSSALKHRSERM
jgi:hypothetical protein